MREETALCKYVLRCVEVRTEEVRIEHHVIMMETYHRGIRSSFFSFTQLHIHAGQREHLCLLTEA